MPGNSAVLTLGCPRAGSHILRPNLVPTLGLSREQSLPWEDELPWLSASVLTL